MCDPLVTTTDLTVELGGDPVLTGLTLAVRPGELVAVVGENGSGKSTLLRCLAGLQPPTSGEVTVLGAAPADTAAFWARVVLTADEPAWYPGLTVREHLDLVLAVHSAPRMSTGAALESFALTARADAVPASLSTGQRQRLSLAATLLRPSRLLLLDEPERGLDADFRPRLGDLLEEYAGAGGTVIMATHDPALAARARRLSPVPA
ncbi:heme ABC exporter ATP-binding protein CcmA [Nonomuraea typhae]|uniref:heme ABC exporter ATP-binding protein CcmA n=1 Tax=Nonomuraea typhae TaxID=2603600 RepID=UPI0012FAC99E|nr:heme ABC exporter ATP-binding protein CcmA [Nonomuraea typhae]